MNLSGKQKSVLPENYYKYYDNRYRLLYKAGVDNWSRYGVIKELNRFLRLVRPNVASLAVDVGCGEGRNAIHLAQYGHLVTGIDLSAAGLKKAKELAKKNNVKMRFMRDNALKLAKFKPSSFDFGISVGCLHMFVTKKHRKMFLGQIKRIMKPRSYFFLLNQGDGKNEWITPTEDFLKEEKRRVAGDEDRFINLPKLPSWQRPWKDHLTELQDCGYQIIKSFSSTNLEYGKCMCVVLQVIK